MSTVSAPGDVCCLMANDDRSYLKKREPEPTVLPEDVELRFEDWANNVDWFRPDAIDWVCLPAISSNDSC